MKKTIATLALLFVMFSNLNATEAPTQKSDRNCTVEKCKTKSNENNCSTAKCKTEKKKDCTTKKCSRDGNQTSSNKTPTWSVSQDTNSTMKMRSCCKNKKNKEAKTVPKEEAPMKCGQGKCGAGKCGGK